MVREKCGMSLLMLPVFSMWPVDAQRQHEAKKTATAVDMLDSWESGSLMHINV